MTAALVVSNLTINAPGLRLVHGASFAIEPGESLTILGETGSGKSLLSQAIMGTLPHGLTADGEITIDDVSTRAASVDRRRLWGRVLALLPQEPWLALDPTMRSVDQVAEGFLDGRRRLARLRSLDDLRALGLQGSEHHYPFRLSGGMAQRVAIAATMAGGAPILIVDEPTKGLDAALRDDVVALLKTVVASGRTLLTITHDVAVARALGGQLAIMLEGEIVEQGSMEAVLQAPRHDYTRKLLAAEPKAWPARTSAAAGRTILAGKGLAKRYGDRTLFERLDITVRAGERLAVAGPSGSGKTTVGDILLGLTAPSEGVVERAADLLPIRLQKLYQDPVAAFPPRVTLRQAFADLIARHRMGQSELERMMPRLRLNERLLDRRPDQVSGGELQRFALVRLLLVQPAFIFADEPTSRLDLISQKETIDLLVEESTKHGCALLLVTHDAAIASNIVSGLPITLGQELDEAVAT